MAACCTTSPRPRVRNVAALADLHKALSDPTRLRILAVLAHHTPDGPGSELCVCHIHDSLGVPQPTTSRHLAYLRRMQLVAARRDGVWMYYRLVRPTDPVLAAVVDAALHALGHADSTNRDRANLQRVAAATPTPA